MNTDFIGPIPGMVPVDPVSDVRKKIDGRRPWVPFPTHLLRGVFRDYVRAIARDMNADEATVANMFLGLVSAVIGTRWFIKVHPLGCGEYRQPAFLWTANVIKSGGNKSGVFQAVLKIAQFIDGVMIDQSKQSQAEYEFQLAEWEAGLIEQRKLWKDCGSESARRELTMKYMDRKPRQPRNRRFLVGNATTGAIQLLLKSNPHGLLCAYDELRSWAASMGQYSKSSSAGAAEKAEWLSMWNGGRVSVDRKGQDSPSIVVDHTGVSLVGSIQTSVLKRMVTVEDRENGLLPRILAVWPPERLRLVPHKVTNEAAGFYLSVVTLMKKIFDSENYANLPRPGESSIEQELERDAASSWQTHPNFWVTPQGVRDLCLSDDARDVFIEWQHVNERARDREADELINSLHPKIESHVLRFALIDHACLNAELGLLETEAFNLVGPDSVRRAIQMADWYLQEQKRVYAEVLEQPEESENEKCLRMYDWIVRMLARGGFEFQLGVTSRQIQRAFRWSPEETANRLEMLTTAGPEALLVKSITTASNNKKVARYTINAERAREHGEDNLPEDGDTATL